MQNEPISLSEIRERFKRGENITKLFREQQGTEGNSIEAIEIAYDMQAGSYVERLSDPAFAEYSGVYTSAIAGVLDGLGKNASLMEAGVGEATTLSKVIGKVAQTPSHALGFDISWSRIATAKKFAAGLGVDPTLFVGDLFHVPFADSSVDVVYTSHSIEPNGGREKEALAELYRVARRYLVLLEPSNELGSPETQERMKRNGYVWDLRRHCDELGYKVVEHRLFDHSANPTNETGLIVVEKDADAEPNEQVAFACPLSKAELSEVRGQLFSPEGLRVFPIVDGIPCLRPEHGIVASAFAD